MKSNIHFLQQEPVRKELKPKSPERNNRVKDWYIQAFPNDQLGEEINNEVTFKQLYEMLLVGEEIYNHTANDSVVRKRIFKKLAEVYNTTLETIYDHWYNTNAHYIWK